MPTRYLLSMYTIRVSASFSAAHHLRDYGGKCENPHGHNWRVTACLGGEELDSTGMLFDFGDLKTLLREAIAELDHRDLNTHPYFANVNPTAENIARWIYERLAGALPPQVWLIEVTAEETDGSIATYSAAP
jgi:6-pyruvoyltetrahydropterin/6-carboxytetrahydropterin synthase